MKLKSVYFENKKLAVDAEAERRLKKIIFGGSAFMSI